MNSNNNTGWQPLNINPGKPPSLGLYGIDDTTGVPWADTGTAYQAPAFTPPNPNFNVEQPVSIFNNASTEPGLLGGFKGALGYLSNIGKDTANNVTDVVSNATDGVQKSWGDLNFNQKFNTGIGAAQSLFGMYAGFKQMGMAKKQMEQQNKQWEASWGARKKALNEGARMRSEMRNNGVKQAVQEDYDRNKV